jgi:hypothetical protein
VEATTTAYIKSYGAIGCGLEQMRLVWPSLEHILTVQRGHKDIPSFKGDEIHLEEVQGHHRLFAEDSWRTTQWTCSRTV